MAKLVAQMDSIEAALKTAEARAMKLVEGVSDAQANWRPDQGQSWSICQCLDHLARTNLTYGAAFQRAVSDCRTKFRSTTTTIAPGAFSGWFIQSQDEPARRKFKAPTKVLPAQSGSPQEHLQALLKSHETIRVLIQSGASVDLNRLRFKNPFLGVLRFTVGTGLMIINAHERRHLWQAEQVKKASGYPTS